MFKALRSHKFYVPLITVLGSAGLFFVYYFFYVSWQRTYANDRAFRLLATIGDQLAERFGNLRNLYAAALVSQSVPDYLNQYLKNEISNIQFDPGAACSGHKSRAGALSLQLKTAGSFVLATRFVPADPSAAACAIAADIDLRAELTHRFHDLTEEYFDDILIAAPSGQVLFQKNGSALRIFNLNALLSGNAGAAKSAALPQAAPKDSGAAKETNFQKLSQFSQILDVKIAGADYQLFVQPLALALSDSDKLPFQPVICGLWRSDRLQSEVVSIPYTTLIWSTLVILAVFAIVWPLLKVAYMSPSERLRRRQVFYLLFSCLFLTTVFTVVVLNASYTLRGDEESREQLDAFADRIEANIKAELERSLRLLTNVGADESLHRELIKTGGTWKPGQYFLTPGFFTNNTPLDYPYFDNIFWVDANGQQQYRVTVQASATPAISVQDKSYFQSVRDERRLSQAANVVSCFYCHTSARLPADLAAGDSRFRLEPVYSRNTGEFFVVLARPYRPQWTDLPAPLAQLSAQVLLSKFLSLVDPVMPPGFGYAILNRDGLVQFHSSSARNLIENFFTECRDDPALKALVMNGAHDYLRVSYMGKRQQMEVRPLPYLMQPAPALVVFRDENSFSTVNVACMLVFALLAGLFSLPILALLVAHVMRSGTYPLADLWPSQAHRARYANIIVAAVFLILVFAFRFRAMKINHTLLAVLAVMMAALIATLKTNRTAMRIAVIIAVAVAILIVGWGNWFLAIAAPVLYLFLLAVPASALPQRVRAIQLRYLYLCAALSLLFALVVVPCFGLFRISYNTVNRLALEASQVVERDRLIDRAEQADTQFRALMPQTQGKQWLQSYVRRRVAETLDRYDQPVFDPENRAAAANLKPDRPDVSWLQQPVAWASGWFPVNRRGAQLREMAVYEQNHLDQFRSNQVGDDELLDMLGIPETALPEGGLHGVYPLWSLPWGAAILMVLLAIALAFWFYSLARRVFLLDMQDVPSLREWLPATPEIANLLVIGHPKCGKSEKARSLEADKFDLANAAATGAWFHVFERSTVVLDQFETAPGDPAVWLHKLELLEYLLFVEKKRVIILTAIDPTFFISSANDPQLPPEILDRWAAVLSLFEKRTAGTVTGEGFRTRVAVSFGSCRRELLDMVVNECEHTVQLWKIGEIILSSHCRDTTLFSRGQFMEELLERTDSYYRLLWASCTKQERLVLFQLANDGWANPKNAPAIQHLQRRGLIVRNSGFHIMNESFCRFVQTAQCPAELASWEQQQEQSTWSAFKLAATTLAVMVGVWLLYAQQDLFQLGIGYIAALGTAGGAILTLTKTLRGRGSAPG